MADVRIDNYSIMIASKYFESIDDFINLEIAVKRFNGNMERFHFNPIPLNDTSRKFFPNLETLNLFNENDEVFNDGKIFKYCNWFKVYYFEYLEEKEKGNDCKLIAYSQEDRMNYGIGIPNNVKILDTHCFYNCSELKFIEIPISVTKIGDFCFSNCLRLKEVIIPSSVEELSVACFFNCVSLESVTLPKKITYVGDDCFVSCDKLSSITTESDYFIYNNKIFLVNSYLISLKIPSSLKSINGNDISQIENNLITIPRSVVEIGKFCFYNCPLLSSISIPPSVTKINDYAFFNCNQLKTISIPSSVVEFGYSCFCCCFSLTSINIPSSLSKFGDYCFYSCYSLTSIDVSSLKEFGVGCFCNCDQLKGTGDLPELCFYEKFDEL